MRQEEEKISKLFQQLRETDERHAPSFSHDWSVALSRRDQPRLRWAVWRLAAGAAVLMVLGAGWWLFYGPPTKEQAEIEMTVISQWRSPTESLLRTPGEQLIKRVPRLDESLVNITAASPDQRNEP